MLLRDTMNQPHTLAFPLDRVKEKQTNVLTGGRAKGRYVCTKVTLVPRVVLAEELVR